MPDTRTFCHRLWEEFYIERDGSVYACCSLKPRVVGNINKSKLESICNNSIMQGLREMSLAGRLACHKDCILRLAEKSQKEISRLGPAADYAGLKRIKISFGEACNLDCIMCWQNSQDRRSLDPDRLIRNLDITPFSIIEIMGGEPLFIDAAKKFFDHAVSRGKKVSFTTNGTLMGWKWAGKIAANSLFVFVSLNAATKRTHEIVNRGSSWELVLGNIQRLRRARETLRTGVRIIGHMTLVKENLPEIPLFIETFGKLGLDEIEFGCASSARKRLLSHPAERKVLKQRVRKAVRRSACRSKIITHDLERIGLY